MTNNILWPDLPWPDGGAVELETVNGAAECTFVTRGQSTSEAQWQRCDAIVAFREPGVDQRAMLDRCRIRVTPSVGFDAIDTRAWGALGIPVCNVPDYGTMEVADHAMALLLALEKGIAFHNAALKAAPRGNWRPALNPLGRRLSALSLGVVGIGRIGTAVALRAKAFGMDVAFFDPYVANGVDLSLGVRRVDSLAGLMAASDVVSLHTPLTDETRGMINTEVLASAKPGLILINTARGEIIDLDALCDALRDDVVLAAGLDVLPQEPANPDHPLIAAWSAGEEWISHRLVLTPHSAFFTPESLRDLRAKAAEVAVRYLTTGRLENCVNVDYLKHRR
jgi:lactate dehydrogenase-like 2-hydroxyacid dehydrogenase